MDKIQWENGTLVSQAKVNVGGNIYEVEPAVYSGATPISAENLNQMQDNTEEAIKEKDIILICGSDDVTYNISTAYERKKITFDTIKAKIGDKLNIENNSIKIGSGINNIKISGFFGTWTSASSSMEIGLFKNETSLINMYYTKTSNNTTDGFTVPEIITSVQEGDLISLRFTSGTTGNYTILQRSTVSFLKVEAIN